MKSFLRRQRTPGKKLHLTFEISGQAGYIYDALSDFADDITVSNPTKMTWIYRTSKKNDRIDARKQALLLSIDEIAIGAYAQPRGPPVERCSRPSQKNYWQGHSGQESYSRPVEGKWTELDAEPALNYSVKWSPDGKWISHDSEEHVKIRPEGVLRELYIAAYLKQMSEKLSE